MTNIGEEVAIYPTIKSPQPLTIEDVRKNTSLVKKILKDAMVKDVDYGIIPGCGDKPSLFKPGAEKLMLLFKLGQFPEVVDLSTPDCIRYVVKTKIIHLPTGTELGIGLGECSTDEEKYKWRRAICVEEFNSTVEERRREKWFKGKEKPFQIKQVRTNPADLANTVLKMAKKRSVIDGIISACAASDILTQDVEDMEEEVRGYKEQKPSITMPIKKVTPQTAQEQQKKVEEVVSENDPVISAEQKAHLQTMLGKAGIKDPEAILTFFSAQGGVIDPDRITNRQFTKILQALIEKIEAAR